MIRRCLPGLAILLLLAATPGCRTLGARVVVPEGLALVEQADQGTAAVTPEELAFTPGNLRAEEIPEQIAGLVLSSRNPQTTDAEKAEALHRLTLLYLSPNNPSRSLALAAEAQSVYLKLQTAEAARQEGEIWLALILDRLGAEQFLQQQSEKIREQERVFAGLGGERQQLAQKIAAQEVVNAKLKADIEKLKFIDLSVEKKRKSFR